LPFIVIPRAVAFEGRRTAPQDVTGAIGRQTL
jgi:hypothetical protein